jgi:hypothetical protein
MADEDQPHAALADQPVENAQHLDLHRHIERRGRLVGDQQIRLGHQHHGDHGALAHAAGEFMRIGRHHPFGIADLHGFEHGDGLVVRLGLAAVQLDRLRQLAADGHHRVQ